MNNLAAVLYQSGRYDEATAMYQKALPIYREVYGSEHPEYATVVYNMGRSTLMGGHVTDAEPLLRQSLAIYEKLMGSTHDRLIAPLNSLAMIDGYSGQLMRARAEIQRAEQIARLPSHGELLDQVLLNVADLALKDGDTAHANAPLSESRHLLEAEFPIAQRPDDAWRYAIWDSVDAELMARQGNVGAAKLKVTTALPIIEKRWGPNGLHTLLAKRRALLIQASPQPAS